MTKRKFSERIKQHLRDIKQFKQKAALSRFYLDNEGCCVKFNEDKLIVPWNNSLESMIRELVEIPARDHNTCNYKLSYNIPEIWYNI